MKRPLIRFGLTAIVLSWLAAVAGASQRDPLVEARNLYNLQQYDATISAAEIALRQPSLADAAALVLGRAYLERFRQTGESQDLSAARDALSRVRPGQLAPAERIELIVGLGGLLYADGRFGAAAEQFELALPNSLPSGVTDVRVLEWWATALDREAQLVPLAAQAQVYQRILRRMEEELRRDPGSSVATYWLATPRRAGPATSSAWDAAMQVGSGASLSGESAGRLQDDLDRLVQQVIPSRRDSRRRLKMFKGTLSAQPEWDAETIWTPAVKPAAID